jgi:hypothetical protein
VDSDLAVKMGVILVVLAGLWVLADLGVYRDRALRVARALRLSQPLPPHPAGRPIEQIAADIRRIRAQIKQAPPGMPVARMRGWMEAYDDLLLAACQALDLENRLRAVPAGVERDLERERIERLLMRAGLRLGSPA